MQTGNKFLAGSLVSGGNWQTVSSGVKVVGAAVTHWRGKARQVLPVISPAQPQSAQLAVQCGPPGGAHRPAPGCRHRQPGRGDLASQATASTPSMNTSLFGGKRIFLKRCLPATPSVTMYKILYLTSHALSAAPPPWNECCGAARARCAARG